MFQLGWNHQIEKINAFSFRRLSTDQKDDLSFKSLTDWILLPFHWEWLLQKEDPALIYLCRPFFKKESGQESMVPSLPKQKNRLKLGLGGSYVWYIYLHLPWNSTIHVGTSPMDPMGIAMLSWGLGTFRLWPLRRGLCTATWRSSRRGARPASGEELRSGGLATCRAGAAGGLSWDRLGRVGGRLYTKTGSNGIFTCI